VRWACGCERRLARLIARDIRLVDEVPGQALALGATLIEVDGSRSIDESLQLAEDFYDPFLKLYFSSRR
jgi:hypothetical protein